MADVSEAEAEAEVEVELGGGGGGGGGGDASDEDEVAEVRHIETQLRRFAEERADFDASCALHAKLSALLHRPASAPPAGSAQVAGGGAPPAVALALPAMQREAVGEALRRVGAKLAEYERVQGERQRTVGALAKRIAELRAAMT